MLFKFWSYVLGFLVIRIEGVALEKFVNMALARGIYLWDITLQGDQNLMLRVRINSFKALRHIAKKVGCRIRIKEKRGLPFLLNELKKRKMLVGGAITFLITLYLLSSFVWFVEVKGSEEIPTQEIIKSLKDAGLDKGTPKWEIDAKEIERKVSSDIPELAWIGISVKGTKAIVEVVDKRLPKEDIDSQRPAHIVSDKRGVIKEILVMAGESAVKEGEMVEPGQVLISGIIKSPESEITEEEEEELEEEVKLPEPTYVHAKGIIKARLWYQTIGGAERVQIKYQRTGKSLSNLRIKLGGKEIILKGPKSIEFKHYEKEEKVNQLLSWRNIKVPVEVITTSYYETKELKKELSYKEAKELATKVAEDNILNRISSEAEVLNKEIEEENNNQDNSVRIKVTIETIENIGKTSYIEQ